MADSFVSTANTTYTALAGDATFTGSWVDVTKYESVVTAVKADVDGTLYMEFSDADTDSTADSSLTYKVLAGVNEVHKLAVTRKFYRTRYVNGSAAQSSFSIQTIVGHQGLITAPLNLNLGQDADAIVARVIEGEQDIAEGKRAGYFLVNKFGANPDVSNAGNEDIVETSGIYTGFPTGAAETITIVSSSTDDDEGGTGAEKVRVYGLDANYELQDEEFTLNGTTNVVSASTWTRVFRVIVTQSANGANTAFNAGTITVRHTSTTANVFSVMAIGTNQTRILAYTVPAGYTMYLKDLIVTVNRNNTASITAAIWVREFGSAPRLIRNFVATNAYAYTDSIYGGLVFPEKTDVTVRIITCSASSTGVFGKFDAVLVKN